MAKYLMSESTAALIRSLKKQAPYNGAVDADRRRVRSFDAVDDYPLPFTVRWSAAENSGSGAWVIWMPNAASLVAYAAEYVAPSGLAAASELPSGWYTISGLSASATAVYCAVTVSESGGEATVYAEITGAPVQASDGETVYNILIASMATESSGAKKVRQLVSSTITLGGAGGAGGSVAVSADGPFSPVYEEDNNGEPTDTVTGFQNCYWQLGGVTQLMSDQSIPGTNGFVALKAGATPSTSGTASLYCYSSLAALQAAQRDTDFFIVPLYRVASSKITLDMRRMPVVYVVEML